VTQKWDAKQFYCYLVFVAICVDPEAKLLEKLFFNTSSGLITQTTPC